jgi:hypothetical protein
MASVIINTSSIQAADVTPNSCSGLTSTTAFDGTQLSWVNPTNTTLDYVQIAISSTNNIATSSTLANVKADAFYDHSTITGTNYYWVRAISTTGLASAYHPGATAGVAGTPQEVTITSPVLGQVVAYDGAAWVNTGNVAVTTANTALTATRVTTSTTGARTAFRAQKIVSGSARAALDGPNIVFNYQGTDGGYDMLALGARYDSAGDHTISIFNSTSTDNSLSAFQNIFTANNAQMDISGTLTIEQAASGSMPTGRNGALCSVSNNSYKLAYYNGSSWRYVADDTAV